MENFESLIAITFLSFFNILAYTPVSQFEHHNTHTIHLRTFDLSITDARASIRIHEEEAPPILGADAGLPWMGAMRWSSALGLLRTAAPR